MNGGRGLQDITVPGPSGFYGPPARITPEQVAIRCVGARWGLMGPLFFLCPLVGLTRGFPSCPLFLRLGFGPFEKKK